LLEGDFFCAYENLPIQYKQESSEKLTVPTFSENTFYMSAKKIYISPPKAQKTQNPLLLSIFNCLTAPSAAQTGLGPPHRAAMDAYGCSEGLSL